MPLLLVNLNRVSTGGTSVGGSQTFPYKNYEYGRKIKIYIYKRSMG
jgi:hypothetical protein